MILPFIKQKSPITIAGEAMDPQPLNLEQLIELMLLIVPYVSLLENHLVSFQRALNDTTGDRPRLLQSLFMALSRDINPADFTRAFAILLHKEPEWFRNVKAIELVQALPALDDINDFAGIFEALQGLGLTVKYG